MPEAVRSSGILLSAETVIVICAAVTAIKTAKSKAEIFLNFILSSKNIFYRVRTLYALYHTIENFVNLFCFATGNFGIRSK
jgi:hypothetical protein